MAGEFDGQAYCAVCRIVLDHEHTDGVDRWIHPVQRARRDPTVADHEPEPVLVGADDPLFDARTHCDFCDVRSPVWTYPCADFAYTMGYGSKGAWAACDSCAAFIEAKRFKALARRTAGVRLTLIPLLTGLYETFETHRTAPRIRHRP